VCVYHWVKLLPCHCGRSCNRQSGVVNVVSELYVGAFQQFYTIWRAQHKTIADSGFVLAGDWYVARPESIIKAKNRNLFVGVFSPITFRFPFPPPFISFASLPALKWPLKCSYGIWRSASSFPTPHPSGRKWHLQPPNTALNTPQMYLAWTPTHFWCV